MTVRRKITHYKSFQHVYGLYCLLLTLKPSNIIGCAFINSGKLINYIH